MCQDPLMHKLQMPSLAYGTLVALPACRSWQEVDRGFEVDEFETRNKADSRDFTSDIKKMAQQRKKKQQTTSHVLTEVKDAATRPSTSHDPTLASLFATSVSFAPDDTSSSWEY